MQGNHLPLIYNKQKFRFTDWEFNAGPAVGAATRNQLKERVSESRSSGFC